MHGLESRLKFPSDNHDQFQDDYVGTYTYASMYVCRVWVQAKAGMYISMYSTRDRCSRP